MIIRSSSSKKETDHFILCNNLNSRVGNGRSGFLAVYNVSSIFMLLHKAGE